MINSEIDLESRKIDIASLSMSVYELLELFEHGELDLHPELQRHADIWKAKAQSRLIESLMLGLPLQSFYFDVDRSGGGQVWRVVDGLQRLTSIVKFIKGIEGRSLRLTGLEYVRQYDGCCFADLPEATQRKVLETRLQVYAIRPGTPTWVKFNIFKRVNTGGLPLRSQEIRHVLLHGRGIAFIDALAKERAFIEATQHRISEKRMLDSEYVNRFVAFLVLDVEESFTDMEPFLNDAVRMLDVMSESGLADVRDRFLKAMVFCREAFGDVAFRRLRAKTDDFAPQINKAIFDAVAVNAARLTDGERRLLLKAGTLKAGYRLLFERRGQAGLDEFVANSTGDRQVVLGRMRLVHDFFREHLEGCR